MWKNDEWRMTMALRGRSVIVAGAGLAGLTAAFELHRAGADVIVLEARDRIGGRVWTIHEGFRDGQHAEAGGDLIEEDHEEIRQLLDRVGLQLAPILRHGFGFIRQARSGRPLKRFDSITPLWDQLTAALRPVVEAYELNAGRWDSPVIQSLARTSVADWVSPSKLGADIRAMIQGLRGFFLAEPADLSLLTLVEQVASGNPGHPKRFYRIAGGNARLPHALAAELGRRVRRNAVLQAVHQTARSVRVAITTASGELRQLSADYLIIAVPATTLGKIHFDPPLPPQQRLAMTTLPYGAAVKTLIQFPRRFWRASSRPRAYGTNLPIGALWEGNEEQAGRAGILTLLGGGSFAMHTLKIVSTQGTAGLLSYLRQLGAGDISVLTSHIVSWTDDPWSRGGYAYFNPAFNPGLRPWLSRAHGRCLFAGEHTSLAWQGYMNGAVESGLRAVSEIRALEEAPYRGGKLHRVPPHDQTG